MSMKLPKTVEKYAESPIFTEDTVPRKLTREHNTKSGVWGRLIVLEGGLDFVIPGPPSTTQHIEAGSVVIIEPMVLHYVVLNEPVQFKIEFLK